MINKIALVFCTIGLCIMLSCDSDKLPPQETLDCGTNDYTYDANVKAIIDATCAYTDCHVSGFSDGDFTNYAGMVSRLDNGKITERVLEKRDMPPDYADGPTVLSDEQIKIFTCWIQSGFPEN